MTLQSGERTLASFMTFSAAAVMWADITTVKKSSAAFILCLGTFPNEVRFITCFSWNKVPLS